jgi:hypothetical protein
MVEAINSHVEIHIQATDNKKMTSPKILKLRQTVEDVLIAELIKEIYDNYVPYPPFRRSVKKMVAKV